MPTTTPRRPLLGWTIATASALAVASAFVGCAAKPASPASSGQPPTSIAQPVAVAPPQAAPQDAERVTRKVFQIILYQLAVPRGSISANATFWKPFDEAFLGIWQHDVLAKNGLRVGRARLGELDYLRDQLDGAEQTVPQNVVGSEAKETEIAVRTGVPHQTIFSFDRDGNSEGRDYERCDDLFAISFRQAPRQQDRLRIALAPMIRPQQAKLEITNSTTFEMRWVKRQSLYDVGISLDLGVGECLVVAPNDAAAANLTLVGRVFMMEDRPSQMVEKVLVIVPTIAGTLTEVPPTADARR